MEQNIKDQQLWELAKKRAGFKWSLISYLCVNSFLVGVWFFTSRTHYFWPMWPMLGWGIGLVFQYLDAYQTNSLFSAQSEYEKLKSENK